MKTRALFVAIFILAIAAEFLLLRHSKKPSLILLGYQDSGTNGCSIAKLELRNPTRKFIWLYYYGEFGEKPPFIGQRQAHIFNGRIQHMWERVPPGGAREVEFPLFAGQAPKRAGLEYDLATLQEWNEYLTARNVAAHLYKGPPWKEKLERWWFYKKRWFNMPKVQEVWCEDVLSFSAESRQGPGK